MRSVLEWSRRLRRSLEELGFKATTPAAAGDCAELVVEGRGLTFYLYIHRGSVSEDYWIVKITPDSVGCPNSLYTPRGLITISRDPEQASNTIASKIERLKAIAKLTPIT